MKKKLSECLVKYLNEITMEEVEAMLSLPPSKEMGDYSLPCFLLAKSYHQAPAVIAEHLKEELEQEDLPWIKRYAAMPD